MSRLIITDVTPWGEQQTYYQSLYVTETKITSRILQQIEDTPEGVTLKSKEDLLTHDQDTNVSYYSIDDAIYVSKYTGTLDINSLYLNDWVPHADIRVYQPYESNLSVALNHISAHNIYTVSYASHKEPAVERTNLEHLVDKRAVIKMCPLSREDNFLTVNMQVMVYNKTRFYSNIDFEYEVDKDLGDTDSFWKSRTIQLQFDNPPTAIKEGETVELTVKALVNGELYPVNNIYRVECVDGYAPHRRFELVNGIGKFKVTALGLSKGEQLRTKVNTVFLTDLCEHTMDVI